MTTCIYKRGKYIAADKRATGGCNFLYDKSEKLLKFESENRTIYLATSGKKILKPVLKGMISMLFGSESKILLEQGLYSFKDQIKNLDDNFEYMFIVIDMELDNDFKHTIRNERAFRIIPLNVEELEGIDFMSIGSGAGFADGILIAKPDIDPKELFELCAKYDANTSSNFDIINLD